MGADRPRAAGARARRDGGGRARGRATVGRHVADQPRCGGETGAGDRGARLARRAARLGGAAGRNARGGLRAAHRRRRRRADGRRTLMRPGTVYHVAVHVFKESVRDRVLYNLLLFAALLMGSSFLIGQLTAGQDVKIIKDLGLAAISLFGLFIAIFIGIGLVSKEVEKRSIYALLAKPVRRQELIAGKFAGLALTLAINVAIMSAVYFAILAYYGSTEPENIRRAWEAPAVDPHLLVPIFFIYLQLLMVTAIALFFSTFTSPLLAAAFSLG